MQEAIDVAYYMAGEGRRLFGQTVPSEMPDKFAMAIRRPIGVVGIITPWNFPVAIPGWKLFPALICGNTAVIKPAVGHAGLHWCASSSCWPRAASPTGSSTW